MTATAEPRGAWTQKERQGEGKRLVDYANAKPWLGSEVPGESTVPPWTV